MKVWKKNVCTCNHKNNNNKKQTKKQSQMYINIIDIRQKETRQKYHCGINILRV